MTNSEVAFMTAASEASDAQGGDAFVGDVSAILEKLKQTGITEKQVWQCQLSLKRAGYISLHANYNVEDVDPQWSQAAPHFTIAPLGMRWCLMHKHGQSEYSQLVTNIRETRHQSAGPVADWAKRLNMDLLLLQQILYAEQIH